MGKVPIWTQTYLADFMAHTHLTDAWRHTHPIHREYTHFSNSHQSFARLNYVLLTPSLLPKIADIEIPKISITDHALVSLKLHTTKHHAQQNIWKFPSGMANSHKYTHFIKKKLKKYSLYNDAHKTNPTL